MGLDEAIKSIPVLGRKLDRAVQLIELQSEKIAALERLVGGEKRLSTKEVAEYLGIDPKTVRKRVQYARLPEHRPADGGRPWFLKAEVDQWLEEQSAEHRMAQQYNARV